MDNEVQDINKYVSIGSGKLYATSPVNMTDKYYIKTSDMIELGYIHGNGKLIVKANNKRCEVYLDTSCMEWNIDNLLKLFENINFNGQKNKDKIFKMFLRFIYRDEEVKRECTIDIPKCIMYSDPYIKFNNSLITHNYLFKLLYTTLPNDKQGYFISYESNYSQFIGN